MVEEAEEGGALFGREGLANFFIGGAAGLDELLVEFIAFGCEGEEQGAAGGGFFFGEQAFADQGFNGAVDDGAIEAEELGDLILVEGRAATKTGENEGASGGASSFAFKLPAEREIGGGEPIEDGIFQDVFGNGFGIGNHRTVTVDSSGRRHCGWSLWATDFLPMAMTMTIS